MTAAAPRPPIVVPLIVQARDALVGAWRLVSWENRAADGQITYPMGTDPIGYVLYTGDGRFSVTISRRDRAGFAAGDLLGGTTEEQARAVEAFVAYAGHYSFHGDRVIHHVELSVFPNWVGSDQERWVELVANRLSLSASPLLLAGKQQVPRLVWERVGPWPGTGRPLPGRFDDHNARQRRQTLDRARPVPLTA